MISTLVYQQPSKSYNFSRFSRSHHTNSVGFWRVREKCKLRKPPCYFCVVTCNTSISYIDCMLSHNPPRALLQEILGLKWPARQATCKIIGHFGDKISAKWWLKKLWWLARLKLMNCHNLDNKSDYSWPSDDHWVIKMS